MRISSLIVPSVIAAMGIALSAPAVAQPPDHAPAHGFRAKQKNQTRFTGHAGYEWDLDFGVKSGNCDRRAIATALGGITGAYIANRVADDDNKTVATLIGAAAGALIGNRIGRNIDKADEACIGHALELGDSGRPVSWTNEETGVAYQVVPGADRSRNGSNCREFTFTATSGSDRSTRQGLGCESEPGVWQIVE
ncbi:MAG: RT0821/Lpp0805 family surface protein [Gammaproteobacteria bacterium]|jgi:surface antigen